jgi:hypothetical protein
MTIPSVQKIFIPSSIFPPGPTEMIGAWPPLLICGEKAAAPE